MKYVGWLVVFVVLLEVGLRIVGFGSPPLYVSDPNYQYSYKPSQDVRRLGNRVVVNEVSMRSDPIDEGACVAALLIGDSVVSGGSPTDHQELASTILDRQARQIDENARVLNASVGGWTVDHEVSYLESHGHFGARMIVAVVNSDDAWATPNPGGVAGVQDDAPVDRPSTAIGEVVFRYLGPRVKTLVEATLRTKPEPEPTTEQASRRAMSPGWSRLVDYAARHDVPLMAYMHPKDHELRSRSYEEGGQRILTFLDSLGIRYVDGMDYTLPEDYRDYIHLSGRGQNALVRGLSVLVVTAAKSCRAPAPTAPGRPGVVRSERIYSAGGVVSGNDCSP